MSHASSPQSFSSRYRPALYTFGAVFVAVAGICALALPPLLDFAQRIYFELQADVNARQVQAMERFLTNRLAAGANNEQVVLDFQAAIAGSHTDRGYLCLIDQSNASYLSHPDLEALGMAVKPMATFDPGFRGQASPWSDLLESGNSASGLLEVGPGMAREIVHFSSVPGTGWTVSSHENTDRIEAELRRMRRVLSAGGLLFALAVAVPASVAARQVGRRHETQVARQNELERQVLEAENLRKAEELEQARQLQLSLLPDQLPQPPGIRLSAHMSTATEVGGDYYDTHLSEQGELTLAVGDATGHGLRAGTMVTAAKSLFTHCVDEPDLSRMLRLMGGSLHRVGLPRLFMALGLARLKGNEVELVGAAMPPALLFRATSNEVEEIPLAGLPLGGRRQAPARSAFRTLEAGDSLLIMSDGFPELADPKGELLGYERVTELFRGAAADARTATVESLHQAATRWAGGRPPGDDITFMLIEAQA